MSSHQPTRFNFKCPKCSNTSCDIDEFRAVGGFWSKIFNVQHRKFTTVTCERCTYTELYRAAGSGALANIFDLFTN